MEASGQLGEVGRWIRSELGIPSVRTTNRPQNFPQETTPISTSQPPTLRSRIVGILFPLFLVQLLGFLQSIATTSSWALLNNAVKKPMLQFLLHSLLLCVFSNFALIRTHGFKSFIFVYEARSWIYICYAILDFFSYKLMSDGSDLMPRAYNSCLPAIVTIFSLILTKLLLQNRFKLIHLLAIVAGMAGIGFSIGGDQNLGFNYFTNVQNSIVSGVFMTLFAVIFKALSYLVLEASLRRFSVLEVLSCYGTFGVVISFLEMVFVDSYEFVSVVWNKDTVAYLLVTITFMSLSAFLFAILSQRYTSTLATLAAFTAGPWYIGLANLGFKGLPTYSITVFHVIGYILVLVAQGLYLFSPVLVAKDMTWKLDFYRRP